MKEKGSSPKTNSLEFFASWAVPGDFRLPEGFDVGAVHGLVSLEVIRSPEKEPTNLVSRWSTRESYEMFGASLAKRLGPGEEPSTAGYVVETRVPKIPLWKRFPIYGLTMGALGLLGALEAAQGRYGNFFGAPELVVEIDHQRSVNLLEDQPGAAAVSVVNHSRSVTGQILNIRANLFPEGDASEIAVAQAQAPKTIGPVPPGKDGSAELRLNEPLPPGRYRLELTFEEKGGVFSFERTDTSSVSVRVWKDREFGKPRLPPAKAGKRHVWVEIPIFLGEEYAQGLECEIAIIGATGVTFTGVSTRGVAFSNIERATGGTTSGLRWHTPPLGPFQELKLKIGMRSDGSEVDWKRLVEGLDPPYCRNLGG